MKKINKRIFALIATITTVIAATVASSACFWFLYQPEEPKCLKDK